MAALLVFAFHVWIYGGATSAPTDDPWAPAPLAWLFEMGWNGVDIFFTLSAFLLAWPYADAARRGAASPSPLSYFRRRVLRIFPAYYVQLAIILGCSFLGFGVGAMIPSWRGGGDAFAQLFLWFNVWPQVFPMVGPWWTLPVEFSFYLLLPWLAAGLRPGRWPWLALLIPASWAWRAYWMTRTPLDPMHHLWIEHLPGRVDQFAIGMLAAYVAVAWKDSPRWQASRWRDALLLLGGLLFVALPGLLRDEQGQISQGLIMTPGLLAWHTLASLAIAAVLLACAARAPMAEFLLASRPAVALGHVSYSLYLWHVPVIFWVHAQSGTPAVADRAAFWGFASACLILSLAAATLSWWLVERPALRWGSRTQGKLAS